MQTQKTMTVVKQFVQEINTQSLERQASGFINNNKYNTVVILKLDIYNMHTL